MAEYKRGDLKRAIAYAEQTKDICALLGDKRGVAKSTTEIGMLLRRLGQIDHARQQHVQALEIHQQIGDRSGVARDHQCIGHCHLMLGQWQEALARHREAVRIYTEIGEKHGLASTWNSMGEVYRASGEFEEALERYNAALQLFEEAGHHAGVAMCLNNLGATWVAMDRGAEALEPLGRAERIQIQRLGLDHAEPECLAFLSAAAWQAGDRDEALRHSDRAVAILQGRVFGEEDVALVYWFRYVILAGLNRRDEAREALRIAFEEVSRQAEGISNPVEREGFLRGTPAFRRVMEAWQQESTASTRATRSDEVNP